MRISSILPVIEGKLYQVEYEEPAMIPLDVLQDHWTDTEWLHAFFMKYREDLHSLNASPFTIKQAIKTTMNDADELLENLLEHDGDNLADVFRPLDNREEDVIDYQSQKGRIDRPNTWVRLYAVHYDGKYIITGGAIKLTKTMNTRPHLQEELYKLGLLKEKLKSDVTFGYLEL